MLLLIITASMVVGGGKSFFHYQFFYCFLILMDISCSLTIWSRFPLTFAFYLNKRNNHEQQQPHSNSMLRSHGFFKIINKKIKQKDENQEGMKEEEYLFDESSTLFSCTRRDALIIPMSIVGSSCIPSCNAVIDPQKLSDNCKSNVVRTPLEFISTLNAYVVYFNLFGERFGAIVDTGSPFLTVPSYCSRYRAIKYNWGCYRPEKTLDSGLSNTVEIFDNNMGTVIWRKADFSFDAKNRNSNQTDKNKNLVIFGVLDESLMDGPGGVFFGLIKETAKRIRPSFLSQTEYQSFCVDLRNTTSNQPELVLSQHPLIVNEKDYIPLVKDLYLRYKAPVVHYTAKAKTFIANGLPLFIDDKKSPTYVIFDTGVSGMVVSQELFEGRYLQARKNKEKSLWGSVRVTFATNAGDEVTLSATKPVTTPLGRATPWKRFNGNLIVLGLAFLEGFAMTIDIESGKLQFTE